MPLTWLGKLKETTPKITRWKSRLAAYTFKIVHTKGKDNVVADALSRLETNVIEGEIFEEDAHQVLDDRLAQPEEDEQEEEVELNEFDRLQRGEQEVEQRRITIEEGIINNKRFQVILEYTEGEQVETSSRRWQRLRIVKMKVGRRASDPLFVETLGELSRTLRTIFVYSTERQLLRRVKEAYESHRICHQGRMVVCTRKVESVEDQDDQQRLACEEHNGLTNHRGAPEMAARLSRKWYWPVMQKTCLEIVRTCEVCNRAKYDREKGDVREEHTETPDGPWKIIEVDIFTWENRKYVTFIDRFSKIAGAIWIRRKSAEETSRALTEICAQYGCPEKLTTDRGREFCNERVARLLEQLHISHHLTTTGHTKSRGTIERLHGTLAEHLRLLKEQGREGTWEAIGRAVLAYNHSVHSTTGQTPLDLIIRGREGRTPRREQIIAKLELEKTRRTKKRNEGKEDKVYQKLREGHRVYIKNFYKRNKEHNVFMGPWVVTAKLQRRRIAVMNPQRPRQTKVIHVADIRSRSEGTM